MLIYPAIDLYEGQAVRLYKGDYRQKTVYSDCPLEVARDFKACGATHIHMVDLEGAKDGTMPNFEIIQKIKKETDLFCEIGGGIRTMEAVKRCMDAGVDRVILGTAAVEDPHFLETAVAAYSEHIAVGVDIADGCVAVRGWRESSGLEAFAFCEKMQAMGVNTLICTDISRDGAMRGTNRTLYRNLSQRFKMQIIASGGVSTMEDIQALREMNLYGAIVGKAYYTHAIDLKQAIEVAR